MVGAYRRSVWSVWFVAETGERTAVVGLSIETIMLTPLAVGFLVWLGVNDGAREFNDILSLGLGLVTVVPLVCFAAAAIRLPLST